MMKEKKKNQSQRRRFFTLLQNSLILCIPALFCLVQPIVSHFLMTETEQVHLFWLRIIDANAFVLGFIVICVILIIVMYSKSDRPTVFFSGLILFISLLTVLVLTIFSNLIVVDDELYLDNKVYILAHPISRYPKIILYECPDQICTPHIAYGLEVTPIRDLRMVTEGENLILIRDFGSLGTTTFTYNRRTGHLSNGEFR